MPIFRKLLFSFLAAALLPLVLAGGLLLAEVHRSLGAAAVAQQKMAASRTAANVHAYMENMRRLMNILRANADLRSPVRQNAALQSLMDNGPMFSDLALLDGRGRELYRLTRARQPAGPLFTDWPAVSGQASRRDLHFGQAALAPNGYPQLTFCAALGPGPQFLAGKLNLLDLSAGLQTEGPLARIFDAAGRLIAHSSTEDLFRRPQAPWPVGEGAHRVRGADGKEHLVVKTPVPGTDWYVLREQPVEAVFALAHRVRRRVAWGLGLAAAAAALLGYFISHSLVKPLTDIRRALEDLSEGRFDRKVAARSGDEIGVLAERLRVAQGRLEAKVRQATVGMMAHRIGHDLRQPLAAIRESLAVVRRRAPESDETTRKHFGLMEQEIAQGLEDIEGLLTLGRERPPRLRPVDLAALSRQAIERFPPGAVEFQAPGDAMVCLCDEGEILHALANGLRNARESGGSRVALKLARGEGKIWVRISDDGPGLSETVRARAFTDFFTTKPDGTGLGLGIVKRALERSGGVARFEAGPGATLALGLPAADVHG